MSTQMHNINIER